MKILLFYGGFQRIASDFAQPLRWDVESGILSGKVRKTWPKEGKFEIIGQALDGRPIGVVCRLAPGNKVRVITVYQNKP